MKRKENDLRLIVKEAIQKTGMSVYGISQLTDQPRRNQIYNYLNGKSDMPGAKISKILDVCKVKIQIKE